MSEARSKSKKIAHTFPKDLRDAIESDKKSLATWKDITTLAQNEWICWTISVKKAETRAKHIKRAVEDLSKGKRRPCCWPGCNHR